jgi:predicted ATP-dependent endonuclease of OLD family
MIKSFEIRNFRCFERTKISGFRRINLIGGKNNSGKSVLLEAIYLSCSPEPESINFLRRLRRDSLQLLKAYPERAWENFFFNQNKKSPIDLRVEQTNKTSNILLSWNDNNEHEDEILEDQLQSAGDLIDLRMLLQNRKAIKSILHVKQSVKGDIIDFDDTLLFSMIAHSKGISVTERHAPLLTSVNFVPVSFTLSNPVLAAEYDNAYLEGNADKVLQAIQVIDSSIIEAKTLSIGEPMLYLKRKGKNFGPVSLFGEAINKVVHLLVRLVNHPGAILLIDEIENGIHHTNQSEFWRILFKLSVEFGTQIFATTHSLEMIEAFRDVALEAGNEEVGAYFELARNIRTRRVSGVRHKLTTLDYELKRKKAVRGE